MTDGAPDPFRSGVAADRVAGMSVLDLRCGTGMWRPRRVHRAAVDLADDLGIGAVWAVTSTTRKGEWGEAFGPDRVVTPSGLTGLPPRAVVVVDLTGLRGRNSVGLDTALGRHVVVTSSSLGARTHGLMVELASAG